MCILTHVNGYAFYASLKQYVVYITLEARKLEMVKFETREELIWSAGDQQFKVKLLEMKQQKVTSRDCIAGDE
jgi:hypothetical protein